MAAIITDFFRRNNATSFIEDMKTRVTSTAPSDDGLALMAFGLSVRGGGSVLPLNGLAEKQNVISSIHSAVAINANDSQLTLALPKTALVINADNIKEYDPYDSRCFYKDGNMNPCYYVNDLGFVFLFLKKAADLSEPLANLDSISNANDAKINSITATENTFLKTSHGYWICLGQLGNNNGNTKFVFLNDYTTLGTAEANSVISPAIANKIYGFSVLSPGSGYSSITPPTATIEPVAGGPAISLVVTVEGGGVSSVTFSGTALTPYDINDLDPNTLTIEGDAKIAVRRFGSLHPSHSPLDYLPAWYVGLKAQFGSGDEAAGLVKEFNQISILRLKPGFSHETNHPDDSVYAMKITYSTGATPGDIPVGSYVSFGDTTFYVLKSAEISGTNTLYVVQNDITGYYLNALDVDGNDVNITVRNGTGVGNAFILDGVALTGLSEKSNLMNNYDVVFIENKAETSRTLSQVEDVTVVINF